MIQRPPRSTRTDTLFPYTTLFRSVARDLVPFFGAYAVAKAGLEMLVRLYASETEKTTKIRVNLIDPGVVRTAMRAQGFPGEDPMRHPARSEEHTSELQSLMRISYAVFCLKKKKTNKQTNQTN